MEAGLTWYDEWYAYYESWCSEIEAATAETDASSSSDESWMDEPLGVSWRTTPLDHGVESMDSSDPVSQTLTTRRWDPCVAAEAATAAAHASASVDHAHGRHCRTLTFD